MTLMDTNVLLWLFLGDKRLSTDAKNKIEQAPSDYFVSIVTLWEIATKRAIGKLKINMDIPAAVEKAGFCSLPLDKAHVYRYELLPFLHRDPFDRMLVAQALAEGIPLLTSDIFLKQYGVKVIAAQD